MSSKSAMTQVVITADAKQAEAVMAQLASSASRCKQQMKELAEAGKMNTAEYKNMKKQFDAYNSAIKENISDTKRVQQVMQNLAGTATRDLRRALQAANRELSGMSANSPGLMQLQRNIANIKNQIDKNTNAVKAHGSAWQIAVKNITAYVGVFGAFNMLRQKLTQIMSLNYQMSDQLSQIRMVSGLPLQDVNKLTTSLSKLDVRSKIQELNQLSYEGAKLGMGKYGLAGLESFTKGADQLQTALREQMGEDSLVSVSKMVEVMGLLKKMDIGEAMKKVGSSLFMLSSSSTSTAANIVEFSKRLYGLANISGITTEQLLALGSASDSMGLMPEVSATAFNRLFTAIQKNHNLIEGKLKMDTGTINKFFSQGKTMEAIVNIFERMHKLGNMNALSFLFKDLGSDGARLVNVMATMAKNVDMLKYHLDISNQAFQEGTAITQEYNYRQDTAEGILERANNMWEKAFVNTEGIDAVKQLSIAWYNLSKELTQDSAFVDMLKGALYGIVLALETILKLSPAIITYLMFKGVYAATMKVVSGINAITGSTAVAAAASETNAAAMTGQSAAATLMTNRIAMLNAMTGAYITEIQASSAENTNLAGSYIFVTSSMRGYILSAENATAAELAHAASSSQAAFAIGQNGEICALNAAAREAMTTATLADQAALVSLAGSQGIVSAQTVADAEAQALGTASKVNNTAATAALTASLLGQIEAEITNVAAVEGLNGAYLLSTPNMSAYIIAQDAITESTIGQISALGKAAFSFTEEGAVVGVNAAGQEALATMTSASTIALIRQAETLGILTPEIAASAQASLADAAAKGVETAATETATVAQNGLNASQRANLWMLLAAAVAYAAYEIYEYCKKADEAAAEQQKLNTAVKDYRVNLEAEKNEMKAHLDSIQKANSASMERKALITNFNKTYGTYLSHMLTEKATALDLAQAYHEVCVQLEQKNWLETKQKYEDKVVGGRRLWSANAAYNYGEAAENAGKGRYNSIWIQGVTKDLIAQGKNSAYILEYIRKASGMNISDREFNLVKSGKHEQKLEVTSVGGATGVVRTNVDVAYSAMGELLNLANKYVRQEIMTQVKQNQVDKTFGREYQSSVPTSVQAMKNFTSEGGSSKWLDSFMKQQKADGKTLPEIFQLIRDKIAPKMDDKSLERIIKNGRALTGQTGATARMGNAIAYANAVYTQDYPGTLSIDAKDKEAIAAEKKAAAEAKKVATDLMKQAETDSKAVLSNIDAWYNMQESAVKQSVIDGKRDKSEEEAIIQDLNIKRNEALNQARLAIIGKTNSWSTLKNDMKNQQQDYSSQSNDTLQNILGVDMKKVNQTLAKYNGSKAVYGLTATAFLNDMLKDATESQKKADEARAKIAANATTLLSSFNMVNKTINETGTAFTNVGLWVMDAETAAKQAKEGNISINSSFGDMLSGFLNGGVEKYGKDVGKDSTSLAKWFISFSQSDKVKSYAANSPQMQEAMTALNGVDLNNKEAVDKAIEPAKDFISTLYTALLTFEKTYYENSKKNDDNIKKDIAERWQNQGFEDQQSASEMKMQNNVKQNELMGGSSNFAVRNGFADNISTDPEVLLYQSRLQWAQKYYEFVQKQTDNQKENEDAHEKLVKAQYEMTQIITKQVSERMTTLQSLLEPLSEFGSSVGEAFATMSTDAASGKKAMNDAFKQMIKASGQATIKMLTDALTRHLRQKLIDEAMLAEQQSFQSRAETLQATHAATSTTTEAQETTGKVGLGIAAGSAKTIGELGWWGIPLIAVITAALNGLLSWALGSLFGTSSSSTESSSTASTDSVNTKLNTGMLTYDKGNLNQFATHHAFAEGNSQQMVMGDDGVYYMATDNQNTLKTGLITQPTTTSVNGVPSIVGEQGPEIVIGRKTTKAMMMNSPQLYNAIVNYDLNQGLMKRAFAGGNVTDVTDGKNIGVNGTVANDSSNTQLTQAISLLLERLNQPIVAQINKYGVGGLIDEVNSGQKFIDKYKG